MIPKQREFDFTNPPEQYLESGKFAGADYDEARDEVRLRGQIKRVFEVMRDGKFRTLDELHREIKARFDKHDPHPSLSAQLRHLKKKQWGAHDLVKEYMGNGLYKYRLVVNEG